MNGDNFEKKDDAILALKNSDDKRLKIFAEDIAIGKGRTWGELGRIGENWGECGENWEKLGRMWGEIWGEKSEYDKTMGRSGELM